ncbi:MAG: hypothetical protein H7A36_00065 [Chlamydiales bacterium]|nr:hypothetical protein [Chlamydiales bacterium]
MSFQDNVHLSVFGRDPTTEFYGYFCPLEVKEDVLTKIKGIFNTCIVEQCSLPGFSKVNMHVAFDENNRPWGIIAPITVKTEKYQEVIEDIEITDLLEEPKKGSTYVDRDFSAQHRIAQRLAQLLAAPLAELPAELPARPLAAPPKGARKRGACEDILDLDKMKKKRKKELPPMASPQMAPLPMGLPPMPPPPMASLPMGLPPMASPQMAPLPMGLPPMPPPQMVSFRLPDDLREFSPEIPSGERLSWVRRMVPNEHLAAFNPVRVPLKDCPFPPLPGTAFVSILRLVYENDPAAFSPCLARVDGEPHPTRPGMTVVLVPVVTRK